jgi:hypothetical protein
MEFLKRLACQLGFHKLEWIDKPLPMDFKDRFLNFKNHARCIRCGKSGLVDSQGNMFYVDKVQE